MYKIGVTGSLKNYFFSEVVKALSKDNMITYDIDAEDIDFIFCVNDIHPIMNNKNKPIITWIGERPVWTYLRNQYNLKLSDMIFLTDKEFVEPVKKVVGHNNVFYLPLATSFENRINVRLLYQNNISFVGNTMQKQIFEMENDNTILLHLPFSSEKCQLIKEEFENVFLENYNITVMEYVNKSVLININNYSLYRSQLIYSYLGMLLTFFKRKYVLQEVLKIEKKTHMIPMEWKDYLNALNLTQKTMYTSINEVYFSSKININISSMHMPTAVNSRLFDVPISGGFLLTDYREYIYELFDRDEIVTYNSVLELLEYINYYNIHDNERNKIIEKAALKIDRTHKYSHRIDYILNKYRLIIG